MKFAEAFSAMKSGAKVKLPSWTGYWDWDPEKETIRMHCRAEESDTGNEIMDIRESQRVEYTISNILSEEWSFILSCFPPLVKGQHFVSFHMMDTISGWQICTL